MTFLDRETAVRQLKELKQTEQVERIQNFERRACWLDELNAVVFMEPADTDEWDLGSTMAFESTNGYQQAKFDQVYEDAIAGKFVDKTAKDENVRLERAALQYALAFERIENDGRVTHCEIINQAIKSGTVSVLHGVGPRSTMTQNTRSSMKPFSKQNMAKNIWNTTKMPISLTLCLFKSKKPTAALTA